MGQGADYVSVLALFFGWPAGQVWPNIVASGVTAGLAVGWSHRRMRKHVNKLHGELAEHVTNTVAGTPGEGSQ